MKQRKKLTRKEKRAVSTWIESPSPLPGQRCFRKFNGLVVLAGVGLWEGKRWLHVSCSHKNKMPSWKELKEVKEKFIGDRKAIQIFPIKSEYVNIMPNCLHLWACLDDDGLPDFTKGIGSI